MREILCETCLGEGQTMVAKLYPSGHAEVWDTCPDCKGEGTIEKEMNMDTITLLQIDAGCKLYSCTFSSSTGAKRYTFKSFETYAPGEFALVLSAGQNEHHHAQVVRVEGEGEFSEEIPQYRWLCGRITLPDMLEGERIDATARRKIAIGSAITAAKAVAIGLTVADYTPQKIEAPKETS